MLVLIPAHSIHPPSQGRPEPHALGHQLELERDERGGVRISDDSLRVPSTSHLRVVFLRYRHSRYPDPSSSDEWPVEGESEERECVLVSELDGGGRGRWRDGAATENDDAVLNSSVGLVRTRLVI